MVRVTTPGEVDPYAADLCSKVQGGLYAAGLAGAAIDVIENKCDFAGVESARSSVQYRSRPTEDVLINRCRGESSAVFRMRDSGLPNRCGRHRRPELERRCLRILAMIGFHDIFDRKSPSGDAHDSLIAPELASPRRDCPPRSRTHPG